MLSVLIATLPLLFGDGVHDDTAAIQARLDEGVPCVELPLPAKEYRISRTLRIGSGQELRLPKSARVRLSDGSNCPMLGNRDFENGNVDVAVTGGIWDMNNRGQRHNVAALGWMSVSKRAEWLTEEKEEVQKHTPWPKKYDSAFFTGVCIQFFRVKGLSVRGVTVMNPVTYGIQLSRVTDFAAEDITFDYLWGNPAKANMDGFHVDGGCSRGKITNLRGCCFDDFVALNATDGSDSPYHGPITDIEIDGIDCDYCHSAVRLLSRSVEHPVKRVSIRNVRGRYYSYGIGLTYFHHDVKERGVMDDILISDLDISRAEPPADCWGFWRFGAIEVEQGLDVGNLTIERFRRDEDHRPDVASIRVKDDAHIGRLTIRDCVQVNRTDEPMTFLRCRGKVGTLVHENTRFEGLPGANVREDFGPIPDDPPRTEIAPFVGCASNGHTYPGAATPFGLVQVSPDTGNCDWEHCSGYVRKDMKIYGFSQTHLSGTGCSDLGDVPLLPFVGDPTEYAGVKDAYTESARTGYYSVWLTNFNIHVELTASPHVGWQRWTFPRDVLRKVYVDLQRGQMEGHRSVTNRVREARVELAKDRLSFSGRNVVDGWLPDRAVAFKVAFSEPWLTCEELPQVHGEKARRFALTFAPGERPMVVKTAVSTVDERAAAGNMAAEAAGWDFDKAYSRALYAWEKLFHRVEIDADEKVCANFYTALYHLFLQPNNIADAGEMARYSGFSLWDTFRAAHPLYTILCPDRVGDFVRSMMAHYRQFGYLPVNAQFGAESQCMIGNHAVPVIVDAYLKFTKGSLDGLGDIDWDEAFSMIDDSLSRPHTGKIHEDWELYDRYGYYPSDLIPAESAARTLECGYDDWCASRLARALGKDDRADFYESRSKGWRKLLDEKSGFLRGRDSKGCWYESFDPFENGHFWLRPNPYVEGNAWQYRFLVLQDIPGLCEALGGAAALEKGLDGLLAATAPKSDDTVRDVSGLIGQYAHGNEPCHHVAYLYQYAGRSDKAAERIREVCEKFYRPVTDGLCGNDDCGQMSAWYVFSCLGFYPVNPCGGEYVVGAPQVSQAKVRLPAGKTLVVRALGSVGKNMYVKSVILNGRRVDGFVLKHEDLMKGGVLEYEMAAY